MSMELHRAMRQAIVGGQNTQAEKDLELRLTAENPFTRWRQDTKDISEELKSQKRDEYLERTRRQRLRENNEELRELEAQIRRAIVASEIQKQKDTKELEKSMKKQFLQQNVQDQQLQLLAAEKEEKEEKKQLAEKRRLFAELKQQMVENQQKRLMHLEEVMQDRENMKRMLEAFAKEREAEHQRLLQQREYCQKIINENKRAQEILKLKQRQEEHKEREELLHNPKADTALGKPDEDLRIRQQLIKERTKISDALGEQLKKIRDEKQHRADLLVDLLIEERNHKEEYRHRENLQQRNPVELKAEIDEFMDSRRQHKARQKAIQAAEEARLQQEQQKMEQEYEQKEMYSDLHRRDMLKKYHDTALAMINELQQKRLTTITEKAQENKIANEERRKRDEEVQQERKIMLQTQPVEVLRHIPKSALGDAERLRLKSVLATRQQAPLLPRSGNN